MEIDVDVHSLKKVYHNLGVLEEGKILLFDWFLCWNEFVSLISGVRARKHLYSLFK
jgi:hypothetical protein